MAQVKLDWTFVDFPVDDVWGWKDFKSFAADEQALRTLTSKHAIYVIRMKRPFAFSYPKGVSPVAYIGKGNAQQRITNHICTWIWELRSRIPELWVRVYFCEPRARKLGPICDHVEADLIGSFITQFGDKPLRNRQVPRIRAKHSYMPAELGILKCGKGKVITGLSSQCAHHPSTERHEQVPQHHSNLRPRAWKNLHLPPAS